MTASLSTGVAAARPQSLPGAEHLLPLVTSPADSRISSSCTPDNHLREDFAVLAKDGNKVIKSNVPILWCDVSGLINIYCHIFPVHTVLSNVLSSLCTERDRLKVALEFDNSALATVGLNNSSVGGLGALPGLRASLNQALQQNQDLRTRLARIHEAADLTDVSAVSIDDDLK